MADHRVSVAVSLLVFSLLGIQQMNCQQSGFRVFRTGSELREFEQFNAQQRFDAALLFPAAEILEITGANQAATVQEGVSLNIDCLPWLQRFPGGSIQWFSLQLDEFGEVMMGTYAASKLLLINLTESDLTVIRMVLHAHPTCVNDSSLVPRPLPGPGDEDI